MKEIVEILVLIQQMTIEVCGGIFWNGLTGRAGARGQEDHGSPYRQAISEVVTWGVPFTPCYHVVRMSTYSVNLLLLIVGACSHGL